MKANKIVNILLVVISSTISLFFIEILLRLFSPLYFAQSLNIYQYDSELGYIVRPSTHLFELKDYQQEYRTNRMGTINFQENFDDYKYLIFCLGDSYTQGTGLYADASYPFQLDLYLNVDDNGIYSKQYGIVNLGLAAFGGEQNLITFNRYIDLIKKPNIVLYLGSNNDFNDDILFKQGVRHYNIVKGSPHYGIFYYPLKWIFYDTEIGKRLNLFVRESLFRKRSRNIEKAESQEKKCVAELEINVIKKIIKKAKEGKESYVVLSWANYNESYMWLKSWARENGIAFADWHPSVKSTLDSIPALPLSNNHSGGHYRTWVNNLIAKEFKKQIIFRPVK